MVKPSVVPKTTVKAQSKSLFSDDEDSQVCFYFKKNIFFVNCKSENFITMFFLLHFFLSFFFLPKIFPTVPKSQSKPEGPAQNKPSKAAISIFDDDDEEEVSVSRSSSKIWN